jgi:hypothetical protein
VPRDFFACGENAHGGFYHKRFASRRVYGKITAGNAVILRIEVPCDFFAFGENAHGRYHKRLRCAPRLMVK